MADPGVFSGVGGVVPNVDVLVAGRAVPDHVCGSRSHIRPRLVAQYPKPRPPAVAAGFPSPLDLRVADDSEPRKINRRGRFLEPIRKLLPELLGKVSQLAAFPSDFRQELVVPLRLLPFDDSLPTYLHQ